MYHRQCPYRNQHPFYDTSAGSPTCKSIQYSLISTGLIACLTAAGWVETSWLLCHISTHPGNDTRLTALLLTAVRLATL
jgi:hypothetical protein